MTITSQAKPYNNLQTGTFTTRKNVYGIPAPRSIHIPHWQLRDLVQCTSSTPHSVYYLNNSVLRELELTTGTVKRALPSWEFAPRSFGILDDYVLAGSENGWIQGQNLSNTSKLDVMKSQLSPQINNNICMYTALDGTRRALIGNNDHSIKIWNIDKWRSDGTIKLPVAINHCSISPDKTSMVCVGDSSDVFLFDVSSTGAFSHQATFTASVDSSFSTDFSSTSSMFAVASQDGIVSVWDRRFARTATPASSSGKLTTLKTTRVGNSYGAARLVKFSQGPVDLLMFTEQRECVHLVDARTFDKTQILSFGEEDDSLREVDIAGACFSADGKSVLVGIERAIWQWEIDTRGRKLFPSVELY